MNILNTRLYLVTDRCGLEEDDFLKKIDDALSAGVTLLQLREKEMDGRPLFELAGKVNEVAKKYNVPLLIDDRADIAMAVGAAGVHLGQNDLPLCEARKLLGSGKIIGATAKTIPQALAAQDQGADYLGVGAIFPTTTKVKTVITSVQTLNDICSAVKIPVVAIGGLNSENVNVLKGSKISGVSVVSAIMKSRDTKRAVADLLNALNGVI